MKTRNKNGTEVTLNLSSNLIGDFSDESNFPCKLLTDKKVSRLRKSFVNGPLANIKLSKTQLSKMVQLRGFLALLLIFTAIKIEEIYQGKISTLAKKDKKSIKTVSEHKHRCA